MTTEKLPAKQCEAIPTTFNELRGMAEAFIKSGMFSDVKQLSQAIVKIQAGRELGLPPVYSMQNINLIRNRLATSANTLAMLVKRSGRYNYHIKEHTDQICRIIFYERDGDKWSELGESSFSMEDAKRAELVRPDSGWVKYPQAMLFSRAMSRGARMYCPDAIGGIYTDEEIRSIPIKPEDASTATVDVTSGEVIEESTEEPIQREQEQPEVKQASEPSTGPEPSALTTDEVISWTIDAMKFKEPNAILMAKGWVANAVRVPEVTMKNNPAEALNKIKAYIEKNHLPKLM